MTDFYLHVREEIDQFLRRGQDLLQSVQSPLSDSSSTRCLSTISFDTCSRAINIFDLFIQSLLADTAESFDESNSIVSIVVESVDLVDILAVHQSLFIEYAMNDYLFLDEHFHSLYKKSQIILEHLQSYSTISDEFYSLEKNLLTYLPLPYSQPFSSSRSLARRVALTLIERTAESMASLNNCFVHEETIEEDNDAIVPSSDLFSATSIFNHLSENDAKLRLHPKSDQQKSLLQLDTIDIHTGSSSQSPRLATFQLDLESLVTIEDDLKHPNQWIEIEREFSQNALSIWSRRGFNPSTLNPCSSRIFWSFLMFFKSFECQSNSEYLSIIHWSLALLTIQALNRDWDRLYSRTLINTIVTNRWKIIQYSEKIRLSTVGHHLNQLFRLLIQIHSILQDMNTVVNRPSPCHIFFRSMWNSFQNAFLQKVFSSCHLFILWLDQQADASINSNTLERALIICHSDRPEIAEKFCQLINSLQDSLVDPSTLKSFEEKYSFCQKISDEKMSKLYRRVQVNSHHYFLHSLPASHIGLREHNHQDSLIVVACDKLLKPLFNELETLQISSKATIYERIVDSFVEAWTTTVCEKKYRFSEEMAKDFHDDYEYFKMFLKKTIPHSEIVEGLFQLDSVEQLASIIHYLQTGEKHSTKPSIPPISNREKWLRSSKRSSSLFEYLASACCCQRRNRVTTGN